MDSTSKPAELVTALKENPSDPYRGTPLGVEAAWCPNGTGVPRAAAAAETAMRSTEL